MRKSILNLHSTKPQAPRFCDVIVDADDITENLQSALEAVQEIKSQLMLIINRSRGDKFSGDDTFRNAKVTN